MKLPFSISNRSATALSRHSDGALSFADAGSDALLRVRERGLAIGDMLMDWTRVGGRWTTGRSSLPVRGGGFTLVEIAICIAIIGIALVGIIGILPYGMNTQRDTREETIISQDAGMLLPIITQGARNADDLTNYVYAITNYWTLYNADGTPTANSGALGYTYTGFPAPSPSTPAPPYPTGASAVLTNGVNIVGLLSTPEFVANLSGTPAYPTVPAVFNTGGFQVYSNHIIAYVRSMSGLATEKPPQDNSIMIGDAFSYRLVVVNAPIALDTNTFAGSLYSAYNARIWQNQREFRMTVYWPLLPNGNIGREPPLTYRTTIAGQLAGNYYNNQWLYFYQPLSFIVNTNLP